MDHIIHNLLEGSAEMVVMEEGGEGTRVSMPEVLAEVGKVGRQRNGFAPVPLVIVLDYDLDVGKKFLGCSLEHAESQGLKPDVRVVEILNGRLNEKDLHKIGEDMGILKVTSKTTGFS